MNQEMIAALRELERIERYAFESLLYVVSEAMS
jgi:hypothetical protein